MDGVVELLLLLLLFMLSFELRIVDDAAEKSELLFVSSTFISTLGVSNFCVAGESVGRKYQD